MHGHMEVRTCPLHSTYIIMAHIPSRWMFDCCRVPGPEVDWCVSHAKAGDRGRSGHVAVLHRGRVWKLDPWQNGQLLSLEELQR